MKKSIIGIVVVQLVVFILFFCLLNITQSVDSNQTKKLNIIVERISYRRDFNESNLYVYDGTNEYKFSKGALLSEYRGVYDLSKELNAGDTLTITYVEKNNLFEKNNMIIDAYSSENTYLSHERFNNDKQKARIGIFILFAMLELILIMVSVFMVFLNKKHPFKHTKKRIIK